jgi:polysaccharide biosynthesis protein PslH
MKQILMIARCPAYPIHLGDRLIIYHIARELSQRGYAIDLLAFANTPDDLQTDWTATPVQAYFRTIKIYPEPRRSTVDYLRRLFVPGRRFPQRADESWSPEMWQSIQKHLAQTDYDVVHLFGGIQVYEFYRAIDQSIPALIVPYESYSLYLRRIIENPTGNWSSKLMGYLQRLIARQFECWMFTPYARTVVISQRDKDELLDINPDLTIDVITNGIDLDYFTFEEEDSERESATLLFTGNYEYAPNVDAAVHLAQTILPAVQKRLQSQGIEPKLWLVGNAPPPELQALASDSITVTGRVPDVRPYLAQATAFVSPLRLGAGMKNKVLEALAMSIPLVATPLSVDGIAVQDGHDVLIAADDTALIESVVRVLTDSDLQQQLAANGRHLIESRYSWAQVATQYEVLYQAIQ